MASISFDKHKRANITIDNIDNSISFLMNPVFDNSVSNLIRDIQLCDNEDMKTILESFCEFIQTSDMHCGEVDAVVTENEISLGFEPGDCGDWCAVVHNIQPEHSGYWYAAQNLETEKCSLIRLHHELEGIKIAVENIDTVISSIKNATSADEAYNKLSELGLDMIQAKAILRMKINNLCVYSNSTIDEDIAKCIHWTEFIEELMPNNIQPIK